MMALETAKDVASGFMVPSAASHVWINRVAVEELAQKIKAEEKPKIPWPLPDNGGWRFASYGVSTPVDRNAR
jgi:hypothetical protein